MLKEIFCEKFLENGKVRPKIEFHDGLNTIVGTGKNDEKPENSLGKSTLLMIIDFVFGGKEFIKSKAQEVIGTHTICFAFEFNNQLYYFMRLTDRDNNIFKCDKNYQNPEQYNIEDFRNWLKNQYNLKTIELSFREIVNPYFRVYSGNKEISPKEILRTYNGHSPKEQIRTLEKLFEKYSSIKEYVDTIQQFEYRDKIKKEAAKLKVELSDFKKIDEKETKEKIKELEGQKKEFLQKQKEHILKLDAQKAKELAELKLKHKTFALKRSRLLIRIENIEKSNFETAKPSKASYDALLNFFPGANIQKIEKIDSFHEKLSGILKEEHKDALDDYQNELEQVQAEIESLENQLSTFGNEEDFTTAFLLKFSKIQSEIDRLNALLEENKNKKESAKKVKENRTLLKISEKDVLNQIESAVNSNLKIFSHEVLGKGTNEIEFSFRTNASYNLGSPLDDGTGTDYTSLILFDLSVLKLTKLPALIHDSYLLSNIRGNRLENLIQLYAKVKNKQIFLSIDETNKLNSDTENLVNRNDIQVIKLHQDGGELYGYYWGKKPFSL